MKRIAMSGLIALFIVGFTAVVPFAQDWPQWRGEHRDGKASEFAAPKTWPEQLKVVWQKEIGLGDASPSIADGKLYAFVRKGNDEVILCLDEKTGDEIWSDKYAAPAVEGPARSHPGPRSTPTVKDGKVVTLGAGGHVSCYDAKSGKLLWRKNDYPDALPRFFTSMSPAIVDGLCIAHLGSTEKGVVIAYDLKTGDVKWKWEGDGAAYASPVLMTIGGSKQIVVQSAANLLGFSINDGKLLWQVATPPQGRNANAATPIVDGNTIYYTGQGDGFRAVEISKDGDSFIAKPLWRNEQTGTDFNTPTLKDGLLYGLDNKGNVFCINAKTGETAWTADKRLDRFGSTIDAGSVMLTCSPKDELVVFKPNKDKYEQIAAIKVADTPIYAHPLAVGDQIIIKDEQSVIVYSVK